MDAALCRTLTSTLGVTAKAETEWRFPNGAPAYSVVVRFSIDAKNPDQIPAALDKVAKAMTPATVQQCEGWLVMLQAATAHRADSEMTSAVSYSLYASELRQWPADVAKAACERLARGGPGHTGTNWFPTLAELVSECKRLAGPRRALFASLQRRTDHPVLAAPRHRVAPTEEERAAVHQMAQEALARLKATAEASKPHKVRDLPSIAGKPDAGGLTPKMRELIARRAEAQQ